MFAALIGAACDMELEFTNEEDLLRVPMKKEASTETDVRVPPLSILSRLSLICSPRPRVAAAAAPQSVGAPPAGSPRSPRRVAADPGGPLVAARRSCTCSRTRRMSAV